jgi:uncharacterized caspase-like protein
MKYCFLILLLVFGYKTVAQNNNRDRIALIIGNANYVHGAKLKNPVNDANLMAASLKKVGFDVIVDINTNKSKLENAISAFSKKLSQYKTALFFYAGHGMQVDGVNYLLPVDAVLESKDDVDFQAIPVDLLTKQMERYRSNTNIIILDACRTNPFRTWQRGINLGFAHIANQPEGSIIAYAASENQAASDGTGSNGLYTQNLVTEIMKPQSIFDVFLKTRVAVLEQSKYSQRPQEWIMLTQSFYFIKPEIEVSKKAVIDKPRLYNAVYSLYRDKNADSCKVTEFEISNVTDTSFNIRGVGQSWSGKGVLYGDNTGKYDWLFENGAKGNSYILINKHGSIKGKVSGKSIGGDWVYIAYPMD